MGVSFAVHFVIFREHTVQIQCPVQRDMHFPFYHIRRFQGKRLCKLIHCPYGSIVQPNETPVLQPVIPLFHPIALQDVQQLLLIQPVRRDFQLQQPFGHRHSDPRFYPADHPAAAKAVRTSHFTHLKELLHPFCHRPVNLLFIPAGR